MTIQHHIYSTCVCAFIREWSAFAHNWNPIQKINANAGESSGNMETYINYRDTILSRNQLVVSCNRQAISISPIREVDVAFLDGISCWGQSCFHLREIQSSITKSPKLPKAMWHLLLLVWANFSRAINENSTTDGWCNGSYKEWIVISPKNMGRFYQTYQVCYKVIQCAISQQCNTCRPSKFFSDAA